jgi:hypothetical protein
METRSSERTVCTAFTHYLRPRFADWDIDVEYTRDGRDIKRLHMNNDGSRSRVMPDIIIHTRGHDGPNLVAIEAKIKKPTAISQRDARKLIGYKAELGYQFALFLAFRDTHSLKPFLQWF